MNHPTLLLIARLLIVALLIATGLYALYFFLSLTYPFLIAALLAFFMNPIVNTLEKDIRLPRPLAVLVSLLLLFGLIGGLVTIMIVKMIDGFRYLSLMVPTQIERISMTIQNYVNEQILPLWNQGLGLIDRLEPSQQRALEEGIQQLGGQLASLLGNLGQAIANGLSHIVSALPLTLTVVVFIILGLYFISKDWNKFKMAARTRLPFIVRRRTLDVIKDLKTKVFGFITAQVILISLTALINFIGLLVLQVEHPFTIALIIGLVDLLPYLGTGIILIPWGIYSIVTGNLFLGVGLLALYGLTVLIRQLAEPKVLSSSLGLNPLATLISLFAGLQLFGVLGLVIGPVLLVLLLSLYQANVLNGIWRFIKGESTR
ncbi:sporulation integral membrane protein YtvI [Halalkalibacterium halodurans]|uniref:BH0463 protein n=2 Tax=Halalkalibacterium halodurans TaxID=86665 RepID=Q9KFL6_HALH5|nr:sporulation integral membrane protein YtvI [Halalkalibacterium halodurans]MED3645418.1 sporulation integral membrane protein YtvI [Halalkalibacterium halodurans]MED4083225.1 sporulation integral membrane protein YtvI [Halalkalibacterium halodurans]MED4086599.1 sporulation integral membrane protein YtvI [Halalkalibacterium halodurans]MED4105605.1 sporulation integral membrane protein YtvI [Halalkalibacterium halodurans]MED4107523.1 sporulation integral membrane protein YtvI [Halalkalibacteri